MTQCSTVLHPFRVVRERLKLYDDMAAILDVMTPLSEEIDSIRSQDFNERFDEKVKNVDDLEFLIIATNQRVVVAQRQQRGLVAVTIRGSVLFCSSAI